MVLGCVFAAVAMMMARNYELPQLLIIEVTGEKYAWSVRYPGADGELGTADDFIDHDGVHLAANIPTKIVMKSKDFLYGFELPDFGLNEIAVPDLTFSLEFTPTVRGDYEVRGHQMCNYTHNKLMSTLTVHSQRAFGRWSHKND